MKHTAESIKGVERAFADILARRYPGYRWSRVDPEATESEAWRGPYAASGEPGRRGITSAR